MRKTLHRLTAAGLLVTTLALAGCGSKPAATPAESGKSVNLTMMTWVNIGAEASQAVAEAYTKKHPNVHVTLKDAAMEQLKGVNGGANTAMIDGVDIALLPTFVADGLNQAGALKDLSSLRLPDLDPVVAPLMEEIGKSNGQRYAVPISITPQFIMMNQQALTTAGIKEPPLDWTIQDFEQVATSMKNAGIGLSLGLDGVADPLVHAYGGQLYDEAKQAWTLDTPEAKQGLAEVAKLVQAGLVNTGTGAGALAGGGTKGPGLMAIGGNAMIKIAGGPGNTILNMPAPKGPKGRGTPVTAVEAVVNKSSANADVAADFVRELLANPAAQAALAKAGVRPVSTDSNAMAVWHETVGDRTAQVTDLALQGAFVTPAAMSGETARTIAQTLEPYFKGTATLDQVLPGLMNSLH